MKEGNGFYINGEKETTCSFETYLKTYLAEHKDKNNTELPIISGAIGYFSYEYGRKLMEVDSAKEDLVSIPDAVLVFYDFYIIEDRQEQRTYLIANGITGEAAKLMDEMETRINGKPVYMQKEFRYRISDRGAAEFCEGRIQAGSRSYDPLYYRGRYLHCQYDTAAHCEK